MVDGKALENDVPHEWASPKNKTKIIIKLVTRYRRLLLIHRRFLTVRITSSYGVVSLMTYELVFQQNIIQFDTFYYISI